MSLVLYPILICEINQDKYSLASLLSVKNFGMPALVSSSVFSITRLGNLRYFYVHRHQRSRNRAQRFRMGVWRFYLESRKN